MRCTYETPEIRTVELRPTEATLANCKVTALFPGPTAGGSDCVGVPPGAQCLVMGS